MYKPEAWIVKTCHSGVERDSRSTEFLSPPYHFETSLIVPPTHISLFVHIPICHRLPCGRYCYIHVQETFRDVKTPLLHALTQVDVTTTLDLHAGYKSSVLGVPSLDSAATMAMWYSSLSVRLFCRHQKLSKKPSFNQP